MEKNQEYYESNNYEVEEENKETSQFCFLTKT